MQGKLNVLELSKLFAHVVAKQVLFSHNRKKNISLFKHFLNERNLTLPCSIITVGIWTANISFQVQIDQSSSFFCKPSFVSGNHLSFNCIVTGWEKTIVFPMNYTVVLIMRVARNRVNWNDKGREGGLYITHQGAIVWWPIVSRMTQYIYICLL